MRYLRAALNHAIGDSDEIAPILTENPVQRLNRVNQWAAVKRATRHLPGERVSDWLGAVRVGLLGLKGDAELRDALVFLLLTGARHAEVLGDPKESHGGSVHTLRGSTMNNAATITETTVAVPVLWTSRQAADYLGKSEKWLENDRWQGPSIPFVKVGRAVRYRATDVAAYVERNMCTAEDTAA